MGPACPCRTPGRRMPTSSLAQSPIAGRQRLAFSGSASAVARHSRSTITASCRARKGLLSASGMGMSRTVTMSPSVVGGSTNTRALPRGARGMGEAAGKQAGRLGTCRRAIGLRARFEAVMPASTEEIDSIPWCCMGDIPSCAWPGALARCPAAYRTCTKSSVYLRPAQGRAASSGSTIMSSLLALGSRASRGLGRGWWAGARSPRTARRLGGLRAARATRAPRG